MEGAQRCGDDEDVDVPWWYDHTDIKVGHHPNQRMVQRKGENQQCNSSKEV
jgi:hypothetical protein